GSVAHAPFPQPSEQALPVRLGFSQGSLPIENFAPATAIGPQSQGYQQHHTLALVLLSLPPATVGFQGTGRNLQPQPNAIELDHCWNLRDARVVGLRKQGRNLVDALIEG